MLDNTDRVMNDAFCRYLPGLDQVKMDYMIGAIKKASGETLPPDSAPVTCVILSRSFRFPIEATRSAVRQTRVLNGSSSHCTPGLDGTEKSQFREKLNEASSGGPG